MSTPPRTAPPALHPSSGVLPEPVLATHGSTCACRTCANGGYAQALEQIDYLRSQVSKLRDEIAATRKHLALSEFRRLVVVRNAAIAAGDRVRWARAVAELTALNVSQLEAEAIFAAEAA